MFPLLGCGPLNFLFLNFGGVVEASRLSAAGSSLAIRLSRLPDASESVMSQEGTGTRLVAEVIRGECRGYQMPIGTPVFRWHQGAPRVKGGPTFWLEGALNLWSQGQCCLMVLGGLLSS